MIQYLKHRIQYLCLLETHMSTLVFFIGNKVAYPIFSVLSSGFSEKVEAVREYIPCIYYSLSNGFVSGLPQAS